MPLRVLKDSILPPPTELLLPSIHHWATEEDESDNGSAGTTDIEALERQVNALGSKMADLEAILTDLDARLRRFRLEVQEAPSCIARLERWSADVGLELHSLRTGLRQESVVRATLAQRLILVGEKLGINDFSADTDDAPVGWWTVKETAAYLHVSESTLRRYIRKGIIPASRLPGSRSLRIPVKEIPSLMEQVQRHAPPDAASDDSTEASTE